MAASNGQHSLMIGLAAADTGWVARQTANIDGSKYRQQQNMLIDSSKQKLLQDST